jgi:hypothetical protein
MLLPAQLSPFGDQSHGALENIRGNRPLDPLKRGIQLAVATVHGRVRNSSRDRQ